MRLAGIIVLLVVAVLVPFALWGETFSGWFTGDAAVTWLRSWGAWGWLAVIVLLVGDLFLPIPGTPLMSAAGYLYGPWIGGAVSAIGSILSGLLAYALCQRFGRHAALRLAGEAELSRWERIFSARGAWLVALSRWLPVLPEVIACLAGLLGMRFRTFVIALACGAVPMGFAYAWIGAAGHSRPELALALSALAPVALWGCAQWLLRRASARAASRPPTA